MNSFISLSLIETYVRQLRAKSGKSTHYVGVAEIDDSSCLVSIIESEGANDFLSFVIPPEDSRRLMDTEQIALYIVEHEHLAVRKQRPPRTPSDRFFWRKPGGGQ